MKSSNEVLTKMESVIRGDNETEMNASCTGSYCLSEGNLLTITSMQINTESTYPCDVMAYSDSSK